MSPNRLPLAPLAAALSLCLCTASPDAAAQASPATTSDDGTGTARDLDGLEVVGQRVQRVSSPKYTQELVDTPQTITVIDAKTLAQQNLLGLRDALSTLPGITFGAGEGGGGYGDSINLRGFSANTDLTIDGVRDSAQYTRSDVFNLESIELVNGANSAVSGAGSVGGSINLVSKVAREGDSQTATLGGGTDRYGRATADANFDLDNGVAVRLNAMGHTQDVPGRDEEFRHRWGFAPSVAFGLGGDTRFTVSYLHQEDSNLPQYGVPYALNPFNDGPIAGVDPETYFGYRNTSRQEIDVDSLTGVFEHDFSEDLRLRSLLRGQQVKQHANLTALQGSWCDANGMNPYTGGACAGHPAGTWNPNGGPRGLVRDTENAIFHSQTDLTASFATGAIAHDLVVGVAFSKEDYELDTGNLFRNADGSPVSAASYPLQSFDDPYNIWVGPQNYVRTARTKGSLENQALYAFDTLHFNPQWQLSLGARYEHNEGDTTNYTVDAAGRVTGIAANYPAENEDDLFSYRAGLVYKPVDAASIYLSYANSETPSKSSVNGACTPFDPSNPTASHNCNVDPEEAENIELGGKWDVIEGHLALTAAVFRNERTNYRVPTNDPAQPEQVLEGAARVDGLALGAAGSITDAWSIFANYTYLDSEVLQSVSDDAAETTGDPVAGRDLTQVPEHSGSVWSTYALGDWTLGYGATYQGGFYANNTVAQAYRRTEAYWVHRAMVAWRATDRLSLQLNVNNLFDEEYYTSVRNNLTVNTSGVVTGGNGWAIPGDGRSAVVTATFAF